MLQRTIHISLLLPALTLLVVYLKNSSSELHDKLIKLCEVKHKVTFFGMFISYKNVPVVHNCILPYGTLQALTRGNITVRAFCTPGGAIFFFLKESLMHKFFFQKDFTRKYSILRLAKYSLLLSLYTSLMSAV